MKVSGKLNIAVFSIVAGMLVALGLLVYAGWRAARLQSLQVSAVEVIADLYHLTDNTKTLLMTNGSLADARKAWEDSFTEFSSEMTALRNNPDVKLLDPKLQNDISLGARS